MPPAIAEGQRKKYELGNAKIRRSDLRVPVVCLGHVLDESPQSSQRFFPSHESNNCCKLIHTSTDIRLKRHGTDLLQLRTPRHWVTLINHPPPGASGAKVFLKGYFRRQDKGQIVEKATRIGHLILQDICMLVKELDAGAVPSDHPSQDRISAHVLPSF